MLLCNENKDGKYLGSSPTGKDCPDYDNGVCMFRGLCDLQVEVLKTRTSYPDDSKRA